MHCAQGWTESRTGSRIEAAKPRTLHSSASRERARIILLAAGGKQDKEIASELQISMQKSARWRARFLEYDVVGLEKDARRPGRTPSIPAALVKRVIHMTTKEKPKNTTQWSTRTMAEAVGISAASVRRIWHKNGLKPHLVDTFKVSNDPRFAENSRRLWASMLTRSSMLWYFVAMRRARSKRSIELSQACLSSVAGLAR